MMSLLHFFFFLILFTSPILHAIKLQPARYSGPSPRKEKVIFQPLPSSLVAPDFIFDNRRVPTGSNPLHNKKR
ncbi:hypothetical protein RND71_008323 [Anisodus tanguticus]|uniref:Uncharacterized protein n=1 Tax=Anisodus tanguticus TaxID=243964 RepID=A0AAE1VTQ4_9SOLA|nr:hypothetical protein RND71_008323 [Anisodus tanguticus]